MKGPAISAGRSARSGAAGLDGKSSSTARSRTPAALRAAVCAALFGVVAACAGAQTITGSIGGAVTDPSGAVVPNATVTVKNLGTGVETVTHSDQSGVYNFQFLPIGSYNITGVAKGFAQATAGALSLEIDQIARVNLQMHVGEVATTVSVDTTGAVLHTQYATL